MGDVETINFGVRELLARKDRTELASDFGKESSPFR
jgi:hypothetical protein